MKSIVTDKKNETSKPFPKMMVGIRSGIIVLMEKDYSGTIVGNPTQNYTLGHSYDGWCHTDFYDYTGTVTLSND